MFIRSRSLLLFVLLALSSSAFGQKAADSDEQKRYQAAAEYSREKRGVAVLILKGKDIVYEDYISDLTGDIPWILASGTKSFSGVMCAAAIEDGLIKGFDEKVSDTITEWKGDARRSKITIRQLLSLTSGIDAGEITVVPTYSDSISKTAKFDPGTHFEYGPVPFQIFGELMKRKLEPKDESVEAYLKRRVLDPIGLKVSYWRKSDGDPLLPQGAAIKASEWVKFGQLLRDRGKWNGKQIIASTYLDELTKGSKINPAYGVTFWLNADGTGPSGDKRLNISGDIGSKKIISGSDIYMAAGAGNQRLYIIPSKDLVVVRYGAFGGYQDQEFISILLGK